MTETVATMSTGEIAAELNERIKALYRLNSELAAQVDRMRPVVDAASQWARNDKGLLRIYLRTAVIEYEAQMAALEKGSG